MARVTVGNCGVCGRELRVKDLAVRPRMNLTCTCGHVNDVGQDLSELSPDQRVRLLLDGLEGEDRRISSDLCADELARLIRRRDPGDLQALTESIGRVRELARNEKVPRRSVLIGCLLALRDADAVSYLLAILESDTDSSVRAYAVRALGSLGETAAVNKLVMILRFDADSTLRVDAVRSLGNIFYQTHIYPFLEYVARERLRVIRAQYSYCLPNRNDYNEYDERGHSIVSVELSGGNERIIRKIGEAATIDPVHNVRSQAVRTLRGLKHRAGRPFLERVRLDPADDVRQIAAEALNELDCALGHFTLSSR